MPSESYNVIGNLQIKTFARMELYRISSRIVIMHIKLDLISLDFHGQSALISCFTKLRQENLLFAYIYYCTLRVFNSFRLYSLTL